MKGWFIVLEGTEGSGKTTQIRMLNEWLASQKYRVFLTKEPTKYPIGQLVNQVLSGRIVIAEEAIPLLFAADRADHTKRYIAPALKKGQIVLCDRYVFSSLAYQSAGMGAQFSKTWIKTLNKFIASPDLVLFLDVAPEIGLGRLKGHPRIHDDRFFEELKTQIRIREAYYDIFNITKPLTTLDSLDSSKRRLYSRVESSSIVNGALVARVDANSSTEQVQLQIRKIVKEFLEMHKQILTKSKKISDGLASLAAR